MYSPYFLEIRVVPVHTINAHGSGGILPLILNFSTVYASRCTTGERALGVHWVEGLFACTASLDAHYKNIERKLYSTNAAIWYNKTC